MEEDLEWIMQETEELQQNKEHELNQRSKTLEVSMDSHQPQQSMADLRDGVAEPDPEEETDIIAEELSDGDTEREFSHLQAKVAEGKPYSAKSRTSAPYLAQRQQVGQMASLSRRLDHLQHQYHHTHTILHASLTNLHTTLTNILSRLKNLEKKDTENENN
ncbi:uncharacterized protein [Panulirus ornatus]|uniref:uncharacterized protein isoform X2 n=1 Tax=Panulirus ornatus TaxID=150431 RepID=UPI003A8C6B45